MGKKRKQTTKQTGNRNQKSFQEQVAGAVNQKLDQVIQQRINYLGSLLSNQLKNQLEDLYARLTTLEDLCCKEFELTVDELSLLVADTEDKMMGLEAADVVEVGDLVRLIISTKTKEQEEYAGSTKQKLSQAGSGRTFGKEIEDAIIGMKTSEEKEIEFGKDKSMVAKLRVEKISRLPKKEDEEVKEDTDENKDAE